MVMRVIKAATIVLGVATLTMLVPLVAQADAPKMEASLISVHVPGNGPSILPASGSVQVTLGSDPGIICFALTVSGLWNIPDPVDVGMILVIANHELPWSIRTTHSTGCISGFTGAEIVDLFAHPQNHEVVVTDLSPDFAGCGDPETPCILAVLEGQLAFAPSSTATPGEIPNTAFDRARPTGSGEPQPIAVVAFLFVAASIAFGCGALVAQRNRSRGAGPSR